MSDLGTLRAQYKELAGKNPSPALKADALQAKIAELQAAAGKPPVDEAAERAAAEKAEADRVAGEKEAADRAAAVASVPSAGGVPGPNIDEPELSVEDACAELGLVIEEDGRCAVEMLESVSGALNLSRGDPHRFEAAEAVRAVRAQIAKARG
jgi:hypothetical protein